MGRHLDTQAHLIMIFFTTEISMGITIKYILERTAPESRDKDNNEQTNKNINLG